MVGAGSEFHARAADYDAWYETSAGKALFHMEVDCLRPLLQRHGQPYLEIGVGSGRFAQVLGIDCGIDPAWNLLRKAHSRGIQVVRGVGERLPFPGQRFGGVLIALTLCFVTDPARVLVEARRVLRLGGGLVLGLILRGSPWAEFYAEKGRRGHPLFRKARFYTKEEVEGQLRLAGFKPVEYCSTLFQPPGQKGYHYQPPLPGYWESAGFVGIEALATMGEAR